MRIIRNNIRPVLAISLGLLAGLGIILAPGVVALSSTSGQLWHGVANGTHPTTTTTTTSPSTNQNSTTTASPAHSTNSSNQTDTVTTTGFSGSSVASNSTNLSVQSKAGTGSIALIGSITNGEARITLTGLGLLLVALVMPALALSFVARRWSYGKNLRYSKRQINDLIE